MPCRKACLRRGLGVPSSRSTAPPYGTNSSPSGRGPSALAWLRSFYVAVRAQAGTAAYANYADPDLPDWPQAYYGANYARLQQVKRAYDPKGLFAFPQSIRPA